MSTRPFRQTRRWSHSHNRIWTLETLLLLIYTNTADQAIKDRIRAEFYGTPDDKRLMTRLLRANVKR